MNTLLLYVWLKLDLLCTLSILSVAGSFILMFFLSLMITFEDMDNSHSHFIFLLRRYSVITFFIALPFLIFLPTSKQFAIMYVVPKVAESEIIQKDIPEIYDMAVLGLKKKLSEVLIPETENTKE